MMQYCLTPEVTTSSLSINAGEAGVNGLSLYQLGGGFTWSTSSPLYLEGNAAFSRYTPSLSSAEARCRQSTSGTSEAVKGSARAQSASLWSRWRAPTGLRALDRPFRYVLEYAYSYYFGPDGDMVGFNHLNSLGAGLEFDTGAWDTLVTRVRLMGRYRIGENVTGWTIGLGISF